MNRIILILLIFLLLAQTSIAQIVISGAIKDGETKEFLPFATIGLKGTTIGTVSNKNGEFELNIPANYHNSIIIVNYLGYESYEFIYDNKSGSKTIELTPSIIQLNELVIRPLSPMDYIKIAVSKFDQNYPSEPFQTKAYYREKFTENGEFINMTEGVFKSYYPSYQDTIKNQHQLMLYRKADDLHDIEFMSSWVTKKQKKEKRKAEKKGEEYEEEDPTAEIQQGFGGPENILTMDLIKDLENCLDSTKFKEFRYSFANGVNYEGRELLVIDFETRNKVEHMKQVGKIFIDLLTDAIVSVEYSGEVVVPIAIRPILLAVGLGLKNPIFEKKVRYQFHENRWYPENFQWYVDIDLKKTHIFSPNEKSRFFGEQLIKVNWVSTTDMKEIPEEKRFNPKEDMSKQIFNEENLNWSSINALKLEEINQSNNILPKSN